VVDALTLAVVRGVVEQALGEILTTFGRLAFSPVITEGHDYGVSLHDRRNGELLMVEKGAFPLFVWLGQDAVRAVLASTELDELHPDDVFLLNDPYQTGTHMHDVKAVAPVIWKGELICFITVTGHWSDVGGPSPGGFAADATSVYQEGLRIPPVKILKAGKLDEDLTSLIMNNVRIPEITRGDMFAQLSSVRLGQERMQAIMDRFGAELFLEAMKMVVEAGEQQMRDVIRAIPDGTYHYRDCLDNDGIDLDPVWIDVQLTVRADEMTVDFSGSDPPVRGAFNAPRITTIAATNIAIHHCYPELILTGGSARPISVVAGPEVFIGAEFPRACEAYGEVSSRIMDTVLGALWQAVPGRAQGGIFGTSSNLSIGGTDPLHGPYIMYAYLGGGQGANWKGDGLTNGPTAIGVALTPQIETYEALYPFLYHEYAIREDSGGLGKFRGGLGVTWEVELLRGDATMSAMADRATRGARGNHGGHDGATNVYQVIRKDGGVEMLKHLTKCENFPLWQGDRIRRHSPGGGGLGNIEERAQELEERDLREGYASAQKYESEGQPNLRAEGA
jgi:N-methylhydantoinase B